jgi:teichuronic acid biosynthesis glycosyltransferase TuaG
MPLVTIIVPVFNREATISDSLTSIIEQTFQDWKLVVVDDNSTDRSAEIIDSFIERDSRIQSKKNIEYSHSAAGARLSGLLELDTPFVAFLDSVPPSNMHQLFESIQ